MTTVRDVLDRKGRNVFAVGPDAPVYRALELMSEKHVGALMVLDEDRHLIGVVSERDYARKIALEGKSSKGTPVRDIMTTKLFCVSPTQNIDECMSLMTDKSVRHLPVLDGDRLDGVISIGDVVKSMLSQQEFIIEQLEHFISGR
ncbi:MAG: CBS domain-containing protein [Candidatus Latescibacteria bacterium]|nr:CBS domain-containing protein [Candidatus Latescibacterota bacterium]